MQKLLYFICPTDCLEPIINNTFRQENYYISSLGNSIVFDNKAMDQLKELITSNNIREISFVLSYDNRVILDALGNQDFSEISGLNHFYKEIIRKKKDSEASWQTWNPQLLILSYYLNDKIRELKFRLNGLFFDRLKISGKIYNRRENIFKNIYSDSICIEYFGLN